MTISRILRAFETIELEHYVLLDLHERYYSQRLTPEEVAKIGPVATGLEAIPHSSKLGPVARDAVGKTNYAYCIETLRQMGCFFDEEGPTWGPTEDDLAADKVTNFGRTVLGLYRD